jgi:hypothetical protein
LKQVKNAKGKHSRRARKNGSSTKELLIRKENTSKCSKRCRKVKKAFASKVKEEEGSYAY